MMIHLTLPTHDNVGTCRQIDHGNQVYVFRWRVTWLVFFTAIFRLITQRCCVTSLKTPAKETMTWLDPCPLGKWALKTSYLLSEKPYSSWLLDATFFEPCPTDEIFWVGQHLRREVFLKRIVIKKNINFWRLKIPQINFWRNKGSVTSFKITEMVNTDSFDKESVLWMYFFFWLGQITLPYFLRGREQKWYFCSGFLRKNVNFWRGLLPQGKFSEEGTAKTPHQCRGDIRLPPAHWHRSIVTAIINGQQVKELYYLIYYLLLSSLIKLIFINALSFHNQNSGGYSYIQKEQTMEVGVWTVLLIEIHGYQPYYWDKILPQKPELANFFLLVTPFSWSEPSWNRKVHTKCIFT